MNAENKMPRRDFVKSAAILASATAVPSIMTAGCAEKKVFPEGKLNIALIGLHMGFNNLRKCADENLVALCDVDKIVIENRLKNFKKEFPDKIEPYVYQDYREMFREIGDQIDAVIIATPDHTHANITLDAMKLGKHVYTQKPLTHSVYESRMLTKAAGKYNVATQMGNQGASNEDTARVCESIWNGDIGEVREVHAWTNRPVWPQCLNFPEDSDDYPMPKGMKWDLWLGPAPERPYHPAYHPWNWRGRWDFGTGALGDMACHILDIAMRSLRLKYPEAIEASSSMWTMDSPPMSEKISFYFPERDPHRNVKMPPVKLTWYDGGMMPERPDEMKDGEQMGNNDGGVMFVGTKGKIVCGCYARNPVFLPRDKFENYKPQVKERLVEGGIDGHEKDWLRACKESPEKRVKTKSHFEYAGPFNEVVVMGTVASRLAGLNRVLKWDGENMKFTNVHPGDKIRVAKTIKINDANGNPRFKKEYEEIDAYEYAKGLIRRKPRPGWELEV
ncbi:MAG: Gfo/Idh/MocA family oxidoreductase [Cytophagales bacterium]|nr:Gfo/Idh/MocA family oxidoreductase [Cytophagales bacterium]